MTADGSLAECRDAGVLVIAEGSVYENSRGENVERAADAILESYLRSLDNGRFDIDTFVGEFAGVLWDAKRGLLRGFRDPFGAVPFFYGWNAGQFVFATDARRVAETLANGKSLPLRAEKIAEFITWDCPCADLSATFFADVHRLLPAHYLDVTGDSPGARQQRYWTLETVATLQLPSYHDYVEAFGTVFDKVVRDSSLPVRTHGTQGAPGRLGCMLSGGLDSSSIAASLAVGGIARPAAARQSLPLDLFSAIDFNSATGRVESMAAASVAAALPGARHHTITPEAFAESVDFGAFSAASGDPTYPGLGVAPVPACALARSHGVTTMLDGLDGDLVTSIGAGYIVDLIRRFRLLRAARDCAGWARFHGLGSGTAPALFFRSLASLCVPLSLRRQISKYRNSSRANEAAPRWPDVVDPDFATSISMGERIAEAARAARQVAPRQPVVAHETLQRRCIAALTKPYLVDAMESYYFAASCFGMTPRHPFFDRRLITFCLAVPSEHRVRHGVPKSLLRHATKGVLPDAVRHRQNFEHVGPAFSEAWLQRALNGELPLRTLTPYLQDTFVQHILGQFRNPHGTCNPAGQKPSLETFTTAFNVVAMSFWLEGAR